MAETMIGGLDRNMNTPVLYRPVNARVLGGVCAGIAQRLNIDPKLVRIATVILSFFGGIGIAGYLTGLAVMPRQGNVDPPITKVLGFTRTWPLPALAGVTFAVLIIGFGIANGSFGAFAFPVAIIALFIYMRTKRKKNPRSLTPEPTPFERSAEAWRQRVSQHQQGNDFSNTTASQQHFTNSNFGSPGVEYLGSYPQSAYQEQVFINPGVAPVAAPQQYLGMENQVTTSEAAVAIKTKAPPAKRTRQGWLIAVGLSCVSIAVLIPRIEAGNLSPFHSGRYVCAALAASLLVGLLVTIRSGISKSLLWTTIAAFATSAVLFILGSRGWDVLSYIAPFALIGLGILALIMALRKR
ncbi:MAG: PspC domain-containing protein [Propionibacteriaceae bacterium]|nr:PspC domain-containing protein [Propionibacteriaceae bacterium]